VSTYSFKNSKVQQALAAAAMLFASVAIAVDSDAPAPSPPPSYKTELVKSHKASVPKSGKSATAQNAKPKPPSHDPKATRILDVEGLGEVTIYAPSGEARGLALFASGDGGWNLGVWDMAQTAASLGYWVAGFSVPAFMKTLESGNGTCSDAAGLLNNLSGKVKSAMKLADYHPIIIGYSSGATIAYAALAQAGDARFSGAMTLGFCPDLIIHKPFCEGAGLTAEKQHQPPYGIVFNTVPRVPAPWIVLQGEVDQVCNPPATMAFVDKVKNGKVISLPKVGHGFGVPRNWMPQYRQGLIDLRDSGAAPRTAAAGG
jgi:type IV secretory pathway VirJ component